MPYMVVTLDVSRLSGWLNVDANRNMYSMLVTLDVSRISGWLKADAPWGVRGGIVDWKKTARRAQGARGAHLDAWRFHARSAHRTCRSCL